MSEEAIQLAGASRDLCQAWKRLAEDRPRLRIRDAAEVLGVSEAELVDCQCDGSRATRLRPEWPEIMAALPAVGRVMCLTRNETVVHERKGAFEEVSNERHMGLVLGPDIDLRLFLSRWQYGFAAEQTLLSGKRRSLQFFDEAGSAVLKVYMLEDTDTDAWDALVARFAADDQDQTVSPGPLPASPEYARDVNVQKLREDWLAMEDTHDFYLILNRHRVERQNALSLVGNDLAETLPLDSLDRLLRDAAATETPIMVFVGNRGCIQIHSGPVQRIEPRGDWLNVLDPEFNLHIRSDRIERIWVVRKPTVDGIVTSVEAFDSDGELAVQFFGLRKPGQAERDDWQKLLTNLQRKQEAA